MQGWDIVVVGAGIAGLSAVRAIAEEGGKSVLLLNGEQALPYKRTKASKHIASGFNSDEFLLEPEQWYQENNITLRNGARVQAINPSEKNLTLDDGETVEYGKLILATGAEPLYPRTVRPHEEGSFFTVRSVEDVAKLSRRAKQLAGSKGAKRALVDGMGVLAVEVGAELQKIGLKVTLAGAAPQLMPRQLSIRSAEILEELLTKKGIGLRFQEEILSFEPRKKGGFAVTMIRDSAAFDMVVFCIGVAPRIQLAENAGIQTGIGILVNDAMETSVADIFAAGDVAEMPNGDISSLWHAAEYQGTLAGRNAAGLRVESDNLPFRLKCEVFDTYFFSIGKPRQPLDFGLEEQEINGRYQCFYYDEEDLVGAVMVNDRDRSKTYETAVRERWPRERVRKDLSLN